MPLWIKNLAGWLYEHPKPSIAIGIVIVALILLGVWSFSGGSNTKIEQDLSNVSEHKGEANVIGNLVTNQQQAVNNAANNTNKAIDDLHDSVNRPSNSFNGKGANDRFCRDFPNDPSCAGR